MDDFRPKCVASSNSREEGKHCLDDNKSDKNYFRSSEWTADGTSILSTTADNAISTFIIPPDLLEQRTEPHHLKVYSSIPSFEPISAVAIYPLFNLQDPSTALMLSSIRDHPIRLSSALVPSTVAAYPLVNPRTEAFITPHSLLFLKDGTRFVAGSDNLLSTFDLSRPGQEPVSSLPTSSRRVNSSTNPGMSMRGIVSAVAIDEESRLLAAATFTRHIGLYDSGGVGECVGVFTIEGTEADKIIGGRGATQLLWSPCGTYLYIAERKSDGVMIYDIRQTGQLVSWLQGRKAMTNQRLGIDASTADGGHEIWAGGTDGLVRAWRNVHQREGGLKPDFEWTAHADAVSSTVVHRGGGVVATSSGQRHYSSTEDHETIAGFAPNFDNSLKLWATYGS